SWSFSTKGPVTVLSARQTDGVSGAQANMASLSREELTLINAIRELDNIGKKGVYITAIGHLNEAMRDREIRKDKRKKEFLDKAIKDLSKAISST
ncbi:hypothetical protein ACFL0H_13420, partial [Thermodesulfobacteriota bacterium]